MVQNKQVTPWHFGSFPETLSGWKSILHEKAHIPDGGNTRGLFPSVDRAQMTGLLCAVQGRDRRDRLGVMVRAFFTRATSGQGRWVVKVRSGVVLTSVTLGQTGVRAVVIV